MGSNELELGQKNMLLVLHTASPETSRVAIFLNSSTKLKVRNSQNLTFLSSLCHPPVRVGFFYIEWDAVPVTGLSFVSGCNPLSQWEPKAYCFPFLLLFNFNVGLSKWYEMSWYVRLSVCLPSVSDKQWMECVAILYCVGWQEQQKAKEESEWVAETEFQNWKRCEDVSAWPVAHVCIPDWSRAPSPIASSCHCTAISVSAIIIRNPRGGKSSSLHFNA